MFINSQAGLLSPEKLANSAVLASGQSQRLESSGGSIRAIFAVFGELMGAAVASLSEKQLAGATAAIGGLAWLISTSFFAATEHAIRNQDLKQ